MCYQILNNQNSLSSSCLDTASLAQPYSLPPLFCKAVLISANGESECFGRVMWSYSSLSHNRRTDGFLPLGLSGKHSHKAQSHFCSVLQLYSCVCSTVARERCPEIRVTELLFLPRHRELCLHALNKLWKLLSFVSLYKHEPFRSQKRKKKSSDAFSLSSIGKKLWLGEVLWFLWFCDRTAAGERKAKFSGLQFLSLLSAESCYMLSSCMSSLEVSSWWCLENSLT